MIEIIEPELADEIHRVEPNTPLPFIPHCPAGEPAADPEPTEPVVELTPGGEVSTLAVVELLLKDEQVLNRLLSSEQRQRELLPKFMAIAVACFATYGVVMTGILNSFAWRSDYWLSHLPPAHAGHLSMGNLTAAYTLGLIAANGICLPSFYFYGLLAGLRTTMLAIAAQALKGMASGGLALVGLVPVYLALALTPLVTPHELESGYRWLTLFGLLLPFLAGLRGAASLYTGLSGLAETMTPARRTQRGCLLRRMVLAWIGCFTLVTPVVIYSLWSLLGHWTVAIGG